MPLKFPNGTLATLGEHVHSSKQADTYEAIATKGSERLGKVFVKIETAKAETGSLQHEALALNDLGHMSGIPQLIALGAAEVEGRTAAALVTQFIPGRAVDKVRHDLPHGKYPADLTLRFLYKAATIVQQAHDKGWMHGDIKMSNFMLGDEGEWLIDWATARKFDDPTHPESPSKVGTLQYAAPEQVQHPTVGPASDVYSLGVVAASMHYGTWITPRFKTEHGKFVERDRKEIAAALRSGETLKWSMLPHPKGAQLELLHTIVQAMTNLNPEVRPDIGWVVDQLSSIHQ